MQSDEVHVNIDQLFTRPSNNEIYYMCRLCQMIVKIDRS